MANAYTDILSGASLGVSLNQTAYDRYVEFALRAQPTYRALVDKRPVDQTAPGSSVVFQLYADLAKATTALNEVTDPDAVAVAPTTTVTVTLNEYGNATITTRKLELFALSNVDEGVANVVAFNLLDSIDELVQTTVRGGSNVIREAGGAITLNTGSAASVTGTDFFQSRDVRMAVAKLRTNKAMPRKGNLFACYIHPEVSHDLRKETGSAAWRDPHNYSAPESIWAGEIGQYEGAFFVETPRAYNATDGAASARNFRTIFAGQQAIAEAVAEEPHVVIGPITDKLARLRPIGWYGVLGWARYREPALYRVETSSSIDAT
jgi:N4-gp56 family major capsid protein